MNLVSKRLTLAVQLALAASAVMAASPVFAQDADASGDQTQATEMKGVVVTGSRIRQVDIETQQPVYVMDREAIQKTGLVTVGDIVSHMTVQGGLTTSRQSVDGGESNLGGSYVNMRNLGANRVLVLVNGKRWATNNNGEVDLSTIPSAVIDRIEVLKDGASAVYGSDAVTGVINIITRENFSGAEASAYFGQNEKGDGTTQRYGFTMGSTNDKSSVMMNVSYTKQGAMWDRDRSETRYPRGPRHPEEGWSVVGPKAKYYTVNGEGDPDRTYALNRLGDDVTKASNYHPYTGALGDQYNQNLDKMFRLPTEQKSMYVQGKYNFTDNLSFHSTAMYTSRRAHVVSSSLPFRSTDFSGDQGLISADSLYNPTDQDIGFYRRLSGNPNARTLTSETSHLDASLQGSFNVGEHFWDWDVGVNFNKSNISDVASGNVNLDHAAKAIGPSFVDDSGMAQCGTPGHAISGCTPWNVLAGPEALTPGMRDYLFAVNRTTTGSKDVAYTANITGGLYDIPIGGEMAFAAGVERREVSGYQHPDQLAAAGLSTASGSDPTDGRYGVNEAYAELSIPLLRDLPGARDLTFDVAGRYSKYSNFGSTFNAKYGFKWKPIDDLMIRGNYAEAFHAPTISYLYGGVADYYVYFLDPCDTKYGATAYGDKVHNACVGALKSAGYADAANFRQTDPTGAPVTTSNPVTTSQFHYGSNPDLGPETAVTRTLGVVYSPSYVNGLSLTLDWYEIKLEQSIGQITPFDTAKNCYLGETGYCSKFHRDNNGQLVDLHYGLDNMGHEDVEGYDFEIRYRLPQTAFGDFQIRSNSSYLVKRNLRFSEDGPTDTQAGEGVWRLRNNTSLDWKYGNFGATWSVRYFSSLREACAYEDECNMPDFVAPNTGPRPSRRIGAVAFNDVSARWDAPWNARVSVGVNNVFDREPPLQYGRLANSGSGPYNPAYDMGRYWFVSYNQTF